MDWQDELRQLDRQLSEGEISAQEYRRKRDELLAEASAPAQGRGSLWSSARPDSPPPPFPAAPDAPTDDAPPAPDADETQIVADTTVTVDKAVVQDEDKTEVVDAKTAAALPSEEQTQVVADAVTQAPPDRPTEPAPDLPTKPAPEPVRAVETETETVAGPPSRPIMRPAVMPEKSEKVPTFPPRPSDTPPPLAPPLPPPAAWTGHQVIGEEVFADAKPHSTARRAATAAFSLLVVLALVGGAVWFFVFRSDDAPAAEAQKPQASEEPAPSQPTSSAPAPSNAPAPVPDGNLAAVVGPLPGAADKNSGTITVTRAGKLKLISPLEVEAAQEAKASDVIFRGSTNGSVGMALLVFTTPNGRSAQQLMGDERAYLLQHGFSNGRDLSSGLPVLESREGGATVYRVVYSTGKYTVRFGVAQRDAKPQELRQALTAVADTILAVLPPS